jgi:DNA ligase (NAD+)
MKELIERHGGRTTDSVTKKTDYVLSGNEPGKNKIDKAKEFSVRIIDENEFMKMVGGK